MIIQNVLNNNAVVARHQQREVIVVERGIGFRAKKDAKMAFRDSMKRGSSKTENRDGDDCQSAQCLFGFGRWNHSGGRKAIANHVQQLSVD